MAESSGGTHRAGVPVGPATEREGTDASPADVADQAREVAPRPSQPRPNMDVEASEADVLDQAREVPLDEDLDA